MNRRRQERHEAVCGGHPRTEPYRLVCAAVRDWQNGDATADAVTSVALAGAAGDEAAARELMRRAVEWWHRMESYRDWNGDPIRRPA